MIEHERFIDQSDLSWVMVRQAEWKGNERSEISIVKKAWSSPVFVVGS